MLAERRHHRVLHFLAALMLTTVLLPASSSQAQDYSQLQVLLPGEAPAPGTPAGKLGIPDHQTVGLPFNVTVRACDNDWDVVTTVTNQIELSSTDVAATLPDPAFLVDGEAILEVTLNSAGNFTISAVDLSDPTIPEAFSSEVTASIVEGFEFTPISQKNQYAGVPMSTTVTAIDALGNQVTGFSGQVRLREITSLGEGRIEPDEVTLSGGEWSGSVTMYRADETSIPRGNVNVYAYLENDPTKAGTSDPFTVHPGPLARLQVVVPGESPLPGSITGLTGSPASQSAGEDFIVDVYSTDEYWNPVPCSHFVRLNSSDSLATTPQSASLSDGFREFTVALGTLGIQTLTVTDLADPSIDDMTSAGISVIPSAPDHFEIDPFPTPVAAGDSVTISIRATDVTGNTIPDFEGDAILTANTGPGTISPDLIRFTSGVWNGVMVFRCAGGAVSFTCADFGSPPHVGTSPSFAVLAGPYTALQVLLPGETPQGGTAAGYSGEPDDQNAGSEFTVRIRAVDAYWNRITDVTDRITLNPSDGYADIAVDTTLVNGELFLPVTMFEAGPQTVTVSSVDSTWVTPYTSNPTTVLAGPYTQIVILAPGEELLSGSAEGRTGIPLEQSVDVAFDVTVLAVDDWWNPIGGITDVMSLTSTDPLAELPADTAMVEGLAVMSVRIRSGGYQIITASNVTQPSMSPTTTQVSMISGGYHLEAEVSPTDVKAGEPFTLTVKVTNDAGGVITEVNSSVEIDVRHASTGEPGQGVLATTQFQLIQGQRSVLETYTYAERIILIASDDIGSEPAVSEPVAVSPGDPAAVSLVCDPSWVRANRHAEVTAAVVDNYGNEVPSQPIDFDLASGGGTLTPMMSLTSEEGIATADFLSPRESGISVVQATSGEVTGEISIETALVDPNAPGGTVTSYPNPFHPNEGPTTIAYKLDDNARVTISIYTLTGTLVLRREFPDGTPGGLAGLNQFLWDGRNGRGTEAASGGYLVHILAKGSGETLHEMRRTVAVVR